MSTNFLKYIKYTDNWTPFPLTYPVGMPANNNGKAGENERNVIV